MYRVSSTIYLPVEVPVEVTVTVEVIIGRPFCLPVVFTKGAVYTIASDVSLDN